MAAFGAEAAAATRIACVGDSITYGYASTTGNEYPTVLGRLLGSSYNIMNFGHPGATMMMNPPDDMTVSYWDVSELDQARTSSPDVVVIMLGTNDSTAINWNSGSNTYEADYKSMVALFAGLSKRPRIFVAADPPIAMDNYGISGATVANYIRPIVKQIATETGSGFIDVFGAFGANPDQYFGAGDGQDLGDGIHPNDAGHLLIATTVACAIAGTCTFNYDGGVPPYDASAAQGTGGQIGSGGASASGGRTGAGGTTSAAGGTPGAAGVPGTGGAPGTGGTAGVAAEGSSGCSCELASGQATASVPGLFVAVCLGAAAIRRRTSRARRASPGSPRR